MSIAPHAKSPGVAGDITGVSEPAKAKVNLTLHVTGRRSDGYHLLESLVVFADIHDTVNVRTSPDGTEKFSVEGEFASSLEGEPPRANLAARAIDRLASTVHGTGPVHLTLTKRLPVAAGLGGGSADAAATMRAMNRLWKLHLGEQRLAEIGLALGADVPMCVQQRPVFAAGIGEKLTPIHGFPSLAIVLACPPVAVPTAAVFAALPAGRLASPPLASPRFASVHDVTQWLHQTRNDLAEPAARVQPRSSEPATALAADPDCLFARMSGSGAAAFGLFSSVPAADRAAARLEAAQPDWWVASTTTGGS